MRIWILIAAVFLATPPVLSQDIKFSQSYNGRNLFSATVTTLLQDQQGFLWVGTLSGLYKYDGYQFQSFQRRTSTTPGLPHSMIYDLFQDHQGLIWIGTQDGLSRYNPEKANFRTFRNAPGSKLGLPDNKIMAITEDSQKTLWVATQGGLVYFEPSSETFKPLPKDLAQKLPSQSLKCLQTDQKGRLWIGSKQGLAYLSKDRKTLTNYGSLLQDLSIFTFFLDKDQQLWIGTESRGLFRLDTQEGNQTSVQQLEPGNGNANPVFITAIAQAPDDSIWVGTHGRGIFYHRDPKAQKGFRQQENGQVVLSLHFDNASLLWKGSFNGLFKGNLNSRTFHNIGKREDPQRSLSNPNIWSILKDHRGQLWVGTWNGLNRVKDGRITSFYHDPMDPNSLSNDEIIMLFEDSRRQLWVGTRHGLNRLTQNQAFERISFPTNQRQEFFSMAEDTTGVLWVTSNLGLFRIEKDQPPTPANFPVTNGLTQLLFDKMERLWLGSHEGLYLLRPSSDSDFLNYKLFRSDSAERDVPLPDNFMASLQEARDGSLLLGTSFGFALANFEGERMTRIRHVTTAEGLSDNIIVGILEDSEGYIWLSTEKGINRFDPQTGAIRTYGTHNGLSNSEFNQFAFHKDDQNRLYFGGNQGVDHFDPSQLKINESLPPVVFSSLRLGYDSPEMASLANSGQKIQVPMDRHQLYFEFAALDFVAPHKNQYSYRLEGLDNSWSKPGFKRDVTFNRLPPGTYELRVKASNNDGLWNQSGTSVTIEVIPPFWHTTSFRLLALGCLVLLIFTSYRLRLRRLNAENERLEQRVRQATKELRKEKDLLSQIDTFVRRINSQIEFHDLIKSVLKEIPAKQGETARAFILNNTTQEFQCLATYPRTQFNRQTYNLEAIQKTFLVDTQALFTNVFSLSDPNSPHSRLVLRILVEDKVEGFFVFESPNKPQAFHERDARLLRNLEAHISAAFLKARLLHELNILNQKKNEFMGIAAHDLRGPLSGLLSYADVIAHDLRNQASPETQEDLKLMRKTITRLISLLNNLLDFAAIESGELSLESVTINMTEMLRDSGRLYAKLAQERKIGWFFHSDEKPLWVEGDPLKLMEVLENLISNALKYTPEGGRVELRCEQDGKQLTVHIEDNGPGIGRENLKDIFTRYKTLGSQTHEGEVSRGLGLAIAKRIIEMHHGSIWVRSTLGEGSVFSFSLPLSAEKAN